MGIAALGKDSFEHNQKLRKNRTSLKDHPHFGKGELRKAAPNPFSQELSQWQVEKEVKASQTRLLFFILLLPFSLLVALLVALF